MKKNAEQKIEKLQVAHLSGVSTVECDQQGKDICVTDNCADSVAIGVETQADRQQRAEQHREWNPSKRWNPFNSYKLLSHIERWKRIKRGKAIPPPVLVTIDPTNACNLNCVWCNAEFVREKRKNALSKKALFEIADFMPKWGQGQSCWQPGVKAVCIAGGGEPLLHPAISEFIDRVNANGIETGVVTNGTMINRFVDSLSQAVWVGVSVDAATSDTFNKLKGLPTNSNVFDHIIDNIAILVDYSRMHNNKLGWKHPAYGVSYKYLLYKDNIGEIYEATKLAKEIGCKNIHFRPAGTTWDKLGTEKEIAFSRDEVKLFNEQIVEAMKLDDESFGVYGVTHKFNNQFERANYFSKCHAIFMTAVVEPPVGKNPHEDSFVVGLCCDRRGDPKLELAQNIIDVNEI